MKVREEISKILIKNGMPTRQSAIKELIFLMRDFLKESIVDSEDICAGCGHDIMQTADKKLSKLEEAETV